MGARVSREDTLAIVSMQQPDEQIGCGEPLRRRVAEQRLDLRAGEDVRACLVERIDIDDERQLFDERPVTPRDVVVAGRFSRRRISARTALIHGDWIDTTSWPALPHMGDPRSRSSHESAGSSQNPYSTATGRVRTVEA